MKPFKKPPKKIPLKRIGAVFALCCIAALLLSTLLAALLGKTDWLMALLFCDLVLPLFLYGYGVITKYLRSKNKPK